MRMQNPGPELRATHQQELQENEELLQTLIVKYNNLKTQLTNRQQFATETEVPIVLPPNRTPMSPPELEIKFEDLQQIKLTSKDFKKRMAAYLKYCSSKNASRSSIEHYMTSILLDEERDTFELAKDTAANLEDLVQTTCTTLGQHLSQHAKYEQRLRKFKRKANSSITATLNELKLLAMAAKGRIPKELEQGAIFETVMARIPLFVSKQTFSAYKTYERQMRKNGIAISFKMLCSFLEEHERDNDCIPQHDLPQNTNFIAAPAVTRDKSTSDERRSQNRSNTDDRRSDQRDDQLRQRRTSGNRPTPESRKDIVDHSKNPKKEEKSRVRWEDYHDEEPVPKRKPQESRGRKQQRSSTPHQRKSSRSQSLPETSSNPRTDAEANSYGFRN